MKLALLNTLPIQKSTFSSHAVGEHVAAVYGLPSPVRCRLFNPTQNDLYLVEAAGEMYLYRVWMNVLFDEHKPTLLDFDRTGYGWRAYDLAVFVWWIRGVPQEAEAKRAFLDGYRSEHPQAERILENFPLFVPVRHLLLTADIVTNAALGMDVGRWVDEAFFKKRLKFIRGWLEKSLS